MRFEMPTLDVIGKASELIQGPHRGPLDGDGTGIVPSIMSSQLEEEE
jgi:hypothetical protein